MPTSPNSQLTTPPRLWSIDLLRGLIILLMTLAHTIFFLHSHTNFFLNAANYLGDTVCFTALLFISSAASYVAYIHLSHPTGHLIRRLGQRLLIYLLGYYLLSIFIQYLTQGLNLYSLVSILTFHRLVPFTEFVLAFLLFGFLKFPLRRLQHRVAESLLLTILIGSVFYLIGMLIYGFNLPTFLSPAWKAILFGHPGFYSFPIFQYAPIYFLGLHFGYFLYTHTSPQSLTRYIRQIILGLLGTSILASLITLAVQLPLPELIHRWPPTLPFLSIGLIITLLTFLLITRLQDLVNFPWTRTAILLIGHNAFAIFLTHTLTIYLLNKLIGNSIDSILLVICLWIISLLISIYLAKVLPLNLKFNLTLYQWCECKLDGTCTHAHEHHLVTRIKHLILRTFSITRIFSIKIGDRRYSLFRKRHLIFGFILVLLSATALGVAENYQLLIDEIRHTSGQLSHTWVLTTDPQIITYQVKLSPDIKPDSLTAILNHNGQRIMNYELRIMDQEKNSWIAQIPTDSLTPGVYEVTSQVDILNSQFMIRNSTFYVSAPLYVTWTIDWEGYDVPDRHLQSLANLADQYHIPMTHLFNPRIYTAHSPLPTPTPHVAAEFNSASPSATSPPRPSSVADYISPQRAEYLTNWVKQRRDTHGEEIGLHLHMFPDFVADAGVTPRWEPAWGGVFTPGYDILTSGYTYEEMLQILARSKYWFQLHGLGQPKSFRAGAWFAEEHTLQALADSGFLVDSSGRATYQFGTRHLPGPWHLQPTTQPYYPSPEDQNKPITQLPNYPITILEIPNNGADSYAFTPEQMIEKFNQNFNGQPLTSPRQVTFLSHPHWFDREHRISRVFDHLQSHLSSTNSGPVVYTTLLGVYEAFK